MGGALFLLPRSLTVDLSCSLTVDLRCSLTVDFRAQVASTSPKWEERFSFFLDDLVNDVLEVQREFFTDNLLVRIHFIIAMIRWTDLAQWRFEVPFPGCLTSTFLEALHLPYFPSSSTTSSTTSSKSTPDWYLIAEQPTPAPHLERPEGRAALTHMC